LFALRNIDAQEIRAETVDGDEKDIA